MKIKGVIFDLFDTLAYLEKGVFRKGRREMAEKLGISWQVFHRIWKEHTQDRICGKIEGLQDMLRIILHDAGMGDGALDIEELNSLEKKIMEESVREYGETPVVLNKLKEMGVKRGLLSNGSFSMEYVLPLLPWLGLLDAVVLGYREKWAKPDRRIYEIALDRLALKPQEVLFVGDGDFDELQGARNVGITTVKIIQSHQGSPRQDYGDYTVKNLMEILDIVEKQNRSLM